MRGIVEIAVGRAGIFQRVQPRLHLGYVVAGKPQLQRAQAVDAVGREGDGRLRSGCRRGSRARNAVQHVLIGQRRRRIQHVLVLRRRDAGFLQIVVFLEQLQRLHRFLAETAVAGAGRITQLDQPRLKREHHIARIALLELRINGFLEGVDCAVFRRLIGKENRLQVVGHPSGRLVAARLLEELDGFLGGRVENAGGVGVGIAQLAQARLNLHDQRAHLAEILRRLVRLRRLHLAVNGIGARILGIQLLLNGDVGDVLRLQTIGLIEQAHGVFGRGIVNRGQLRDRIAQLLQPLLQRIDAAADRAALKRRVLRNDGRIVFLGAVGHRVGGEELRLKYRRGDAGLHDAVGLFKPAHRRLSGRVVNAGYALGVIAQIRQPLL